MPHNPGRTELRYGHGRLVSPKHSKGSRPHAASLCANAPCSDMPLVFIPLLHKSRGAPEDLWTVDDHICRMTDCNQTVLLGGERVGGGRDGNYQTRTAADRQTVGLSQARAAKRAACMFSWCLSGCSPAPAVVSYNIVALLFQ